MSFVFCGEKLQGLGSGQDSAAVNAFEQKHLPVKDQLGSLLFSVRGVS